MERKLNVLHVWEGSDSEGRAVREVTALVLTDEQEALLSGIFGESLFHMYRDMDHSDGPDPNTHIEIRACLPVDKPRG